MPRRPGHADGKLPGMAESERREPNEVVGVYLTFPDEEAAQRIGNALVERRLAACVNFTAGGRSIYRWEERVVNESEVFAWAKTTRERVPQLVAALQELHPYDVPCAVAYPSVGGAEPYLDWVREEVS